MLEPDLLGCNLGPAETSASVPCLDACFGRTWLNQGAATRLGE